VKNIFFISCAFKMDRYI